VGRLSESARAVIVLVRAKPSTMHRHGSRRMNEQVKSIAKANGNGNKTRYAARATKTVNNEITAERLSQLQNKGVTIAVDSRSKAAGAMATTEQKWKSTDRHSRQMTKPTDRGSRKTSSMATWQRCRQSQVARPQQCSVDRMQQAVHRIGPNSSLSW
jgi:hypothetical protein